MTRLLSNQMPDHEPKQSILSPGSRRTSQNGFYLSSNKSVEAYEATLSKISQLETERINTTLAKHASQDGTFARKKSLELASYGSGGYRQSQNGIYQQEGGISAGRNDRDGLNSFIGAAGGASEGKTYKSSIAAAMEPNSPCYLDQNRLRTFPDRKASSLTMDGAGLVNQKEAAVAKGRGVSGSGYSTWQASVRGNISVAETGMTLNDGATSPKRISNAGLCQPKTTMTQNELGLTPNHNESPALGARKSESGKVNLGSLEPTNFGMTNVSPTKERNYGSHAGKLTYSQIMDKAPAEASSPKVMQHGGKASASVLGAKEGSFQPAHSPTRNRQYAHAGRATSSTVL
jgi:hypothetical protein